MVSDAVLRLFSLKAFLKRSKEFLASRLLGRRSCEEAEEPPNFAISQMDTEPRHFASLPELKALDLVPAPVIGPPDIPRLDSLVLEYYTAQGHTSESRRRKPKT